MAHVSANTPDEKVSMAKLKSLGGVEKQDRGPSTPSGVSVCTDKTPTLKNVNKMNTRGGGSGAPAVKGSSTKFKDSRG
jgi:hypothetical protein